MSVGNDRTFPYTAKVALPIPADFEAPTCDRCNAVFLNDETWKRLEPIFNKLWLEFQAKKAKRFETLLLVMSELTSDQIQSWKLGKGDAKTNWCFNTWFIIKPLIMADPAKYGLPANAFHIYDFQI